MCGIAGYSLRPRSSVERTLAAQALLAAIAERGADAVGYAYRAPGETTRRSSSSARRPRSCSSASPCRRPRTSCSCTSATTPRGIRRSTPTTIRSATAPVVGIHNGIITNDDDLLAPHSCARAEPRMTVDSEAIFAIAAHSRNDARALEHLRGAMATAWLDEREPDTLFLARGAGRPMWLGEGRDDVFFASTEGALEVVERYCGLRSASARCARARCSRSRTAASSAASGSGRTSTTSRTIRCRPSGRRRSAILPARLAALAPLAQPRRSASTEPSRADRRPVLEQALADQELERRPRAAPRLEHAGRPATRSASTASSRRAVCQSPNFGSRPSAPGERAALLDRALEPLLPHRHVEPGLAQRGRERAEGVPVERRRRHRAAPLLDVVRGRRAPELGSELAQLVDELLPGSRTGAASGPAARLAAFQVPKCSITVCGWTCDCGSPANSFIVGERPSRSADARSSSRICASV